MAGLVGVLADGGEAQKQELHLTAVRLITRHFVQDRAVGQVGLDYLLLLLDILHDCVCNVTRCSYRRYGRSAGCLRPRLILMDGLLVLLGCGRHGVCHGGSRLKDKVAYIKVANIVSLSAMVGMVICLLLLLYTIF